MNQIVVKNLMIFAHHGVHEFEKIDGQSFFIDAIIDVPYMSGYNTDNIDETISYSEIISAIN